MCSLSLFDLFSTQILIIGDSNLVRLEGDKAYDLELMRFNINYLAYPGYRVSFLWAKEVLYAKKFSHVIILCGNNDIGIHTRKKYETETPYNTTFKLIAFHKVLVECNVKVAVVGLMHRGDFVAKQYLVNETNEYLKKCLLTSKVNAYVGPRHIQCHDFLQHDPAHLNEKGKKSVRALILSIIRNRFGL